jgi:hypothetical protein
MPTIDKKVIGLTFWESVEVELFKALFTAILVGVAAVLVVLFVQNRSARKQAKQEADLDHARRERRVQARCVRTATSLAGSFYAETLTAMRQAKTPEVYGEFDPAAFTAVYHEFTPKSRLFEHELRFLYGRDIGVDDRWHQVSDLLTARFLHILNQATPANLKDIRKQGPGWKQHSGLSVDDLQQPDIVYSTYGTALDDLIDLLTRKKPRV